MFGIVRKSSLNYRELQAQKHVELALQFWADALSPGMSVVIEACDFKTYRDERKVSVSGLVSFDTLPATRFSFEEVETWDTRSDCKYIPHDITLSDGEVSMTRTSRPMTIVNVALETENNRGTRWKVRRMDVIDNGSEHAIALIAHAEKSYSTAA